MGTAPENCACRDSQQVAGPVNNGRYFAGVSGKMALRKTVLQRHRLHGRKRRRTNGVAWTAFREPPKGRWGLNAAIKSPLIVT